MVGFLGHSAANWPIVTDDKPRPKPEPADPEAPAADDPAAEQARPAEEA